MTAQQPEALRLAEVFERFKKSSHRWTDGQPIHMVVATELRRLHARVQDLEAQQERKPLTEAELDDLAAYHGLDEFVYVPFARAIERAHGIQDAQT